MELCAFFAQVQLNIPNAYSTYMLQYHGDCAPFSYNPNWTSQINSQQLYCNIGDIMCKFCKIQIGNPKCTFNTYIEI